MTNALIIDTNMFGKDFRPEVYDAIMNDGLKVVTSENGTLEEELIRANIDLYVELGSAGKLHFMCSKSVEKKQKQLLKLAKSAKLQSNDHHVIALAMVSCANTLVTNEKAKLINDFKDIKDIHNNRLHRLNCITDNRLGSKSTQKVIRKDSPNSREVKKLVRKAKAVGYCCECINKGGGC